MFREMRLKEQALSKEKTEAILKNGSHGTLALDGDDSYPYSVPVNYVYDDGKIYFHGIAEGYKYDCMKKNCKVSFSVVEKDDISAENFTSLFSSAIVFGKVTIIEDEEAKFEFMKKMIEKYSADFMESGIKYIKDGCGACAYVVEIEQMTGKYGVL